MNGCKEVMVVMIVMAIVVTMVMGSIFYVSPSNTGHFFVITFCVQCFSQQLHKWIMKFSMCRNFISIVAINVQKTAGLFYYLWKS